MGIKISQLLRYAKDESLSKEALAHIADIYMTDGGPGSGNHHHKGRPGLRGGSGQGGQSDAPSSTGQRAGGRKMTPAQISQRYAKAMPKDKGGPSFGYSYWHSRGLAQTPTHEQMRKTAHLKTIPKASASDAQKAKKYTYRHGVGTKALPYGTGVSRFKEFEIMPGRRVSNTLCEYAMQVDGETVLTPQREGLHHAIIDNIFSKAKKPAQGQKKVFTMLGGGTAAGKSTVTRSGEVVPDSVNSPVIDADAMKGQLPQYCDEPDRSIAAVMCHMESSVLTKRALQAGWVNGYNMTLDGTGDGSVQSVLGKISRARHYGYEVNSVYVTCPTDVAVERAAKRGQATGRYVPQSITRASHANVSYIWPIVAPQFDHTQLYDSYQGDGKPPKLIAECYRGQKIKVYDKEAYKKFLAKSLG